MSKLEFQTRVLRTSRRYLMPSDMTTTLYFSSDPFCDYHIYVVIRQFEL